MNIMYAADDKYAEIMGVSILSLLENNKLVDDIKFYIVEDAISLENKKKIFSMVSQYNRQIEFIEKPDIRELVKTDLLTLRWSDSAYSRLFLKELFSCNSKIDKVIYLDCDTLIVDSLQKLWDIDVSDSLGAACLECMSCVHKYIIGAKKKDNYINTGMLLLNVKKWIDEDIQTVCCNFIKKYKGKTEYVDQGVINGTVSNQFKIISPRYNLTTLAYDFTYEEMQIYRKPDFGYTKQEWQEAIKNPVIIHFTTSFLSIRPWYEESRHPYAELWKQIHGKSPWKNKLYHISEKSVKKEQLYHRLPREIVVYGAGILHAYIKPILYSIKV